MKGARRFLKGVVVFLVTAGFIAAGGCGKEEAKVKKGNVRVIGTTNQSPSPSH